jgi:hypothetical protein
MPADKASQQALPNRIPGREPVRHTQILLSHYHKRLTVFPDSSRSQYRQSRAQLADRSLKESRRVACLDLCEQMAIDESLQREQTYQIETR